jgi:hypothetical protein
LGVVAVVIPETQWITPTIAKWITIVGVLIFVYCAYLIIKNESRLRKDDRHQAVDDETATCLKRLRAVFLDLHECREKLVEEAMRADWRAYLKYYEDNPTVKNLLQKYKENEYWTVIQGQLLPALTNPLLDELKKQNPTWKRLRKTSLRLSMEAEDTELTTRIDYYLKQSDEWDAQRIRSAFTAKYSPSYQLPIEQQPGYSSPRANEVISEVVDSLYKRVQERITELLQPQSSQIGSKA